MDTLIRLLFEQPCRQGALFAVALLVSTAGWWRLRFEPAARRWALATAALVVLGVAGQIAASLITTDREHIAAMLEQARQAVEQADVRALVAMTDESLVAEGHDRAAFTQWLEDLFERVRIRTPDIQRLQITFPRRNAGTAIVTAVATIETHGFRQLATATYRLEFDRIDDQWKIVALERQETPSRLPF